MTITSSELVLRPRLTKLWLWTSILEPQTAWNTTKTTFNNTNQKSQIDIAAFNTVSSKKEALSVVCLGENHVGVVEQVRCGVLKHHKHFFPVSSAFQLAPLQVHHFMA